MFPVAAVKGGGEMSKYFTRVTSKTKARLQYRVAHRQMVTTSVSKNVFCSLSLSI